MRLALSGILLAALVLAGCSNTPITNPDPEESGKFPRFDAAEGLYEFEDEFPDGLRFRFEFAPGAIGKLENKGTEKFRAVLPDEFLVLYETSDSKSWTTRPDGIELGPGAAVHFLAPPSARRVELGMISGGVDRRIVMDIADVAVPPSNRQIISGENMIDLSAFQEANFPHRTPGQPNYAKSIDYFAQYFRELGYDVEVDPYGTTDLGAACIPINVEGSLCPESLANIVATKIGTEFPDRVLFVAGGHYDMVPQTTHAAFDDTSGVVGTMELARALAPFDFRHTLKFALWGGEENGILGSQAWIQTHPEARAQVLSYWNLDVIGMSWPAPLNGPFPVVIAAGPDAPSGQDGQAGGPVAQSLLAHAKDLQQNWFGFPEEDNGTDLWYYEGIVSGQASGYAAVNAQSDHTPFMAAGIPAYFIFNGETLKGNPIGIHDEKDTLDNMTKVALFGTDASLDEPLDPADLPAARDALARSFETVLYFPLYSTLLSDLGLYQPPAAVNQLPPA